MNDVDRSTIRLSFLVTTKTNATSFAGMKKGFLKSDTSSDIIEIKRPAAETVRDFRVLDDVQQAIKDEEQATSNLVFNRTNN
jgi:hypothetical protein